jgi:hypothetical protein
LLSATRFRLNSDTKQSLESKELPRGLCRDHRHVSRWFPETI